jgi:hypothetical protein
MPINIIKKYIHTYIHTYRQKEKANSPFSKNSERAQKGILQVQQAFTAIYENTEVPIGRLFGFKFCVNKDHVTQPTVLSRPLRVDSRCFVAITYLR